MSSWNNRGLAHRVKERARDPLVGVISKIYGRARNIPHMPGAIEIWTISKAK
jgi:hypothetical protein